MEIIELLYHYKHVRDEKLAMEELFSKWVPSLHGHDQKFVRMPIPREFLKHFRQTKYILCAVSSLQSNNKLKQWSRSRSPPRKEVMIVSSAWKLMDPILWYTIFILSTDLQKDQIIRGKYYAIVLNKGEQNDNERHSSLSQKEIVIHKVNTRFRLSVMLQLN